MMACVDGVSSAHGAVGNWPRDGVVACGGAGWMARLCWGQGFCLGEEVLVLCFFCVHVSVFRGRLFLSSPLALMHAFFVGVIHARQGSPGFVSLFNTGAAIS